MFSILAGSLFVLGTTSVGALGAVESKPAVRPNVVVIVADDHRGDLMSGVGNRYIKTPHLDQLAREGCLFENGFCVAGLCSPSRGSILTGKYVHRCRAPRILWKNHSFLREETPFIARLHEAGYHTAHFGKWHLGGGHLPKKGYDHWAGFEWLGSFFDTAIHINGKKRTFKGFSGDILSQLAADHIRERAKAGQPFCVYVGLKAPHLPFSYPPRLEHAFDGVTIPKPDSYDEDYDKTGKAAILKNNVIRIETFRGGLPLFDDSWEKYIKSYYRSAQSLDDSVGRVLKAIDDAGVADDTIVVYTSDQGYTLGEHGMTEKHYAYDQVMRVPLIVRYPAKVRASQKRKEIALTIDIAPTLLEWCGVAVPKEMDGQSWDGLVRSRDEPIEDWREDFLFDFTSNSLALPAQLAVRTKRYKLITYQAVPHRELYDLEKDPHEMRNVLEEPAYREVLSEMEGRLDRLIRETGWHKRVSEVVKRCHVLGPMNGEEDEAVLKILQSRPFDPSVPVEVGGRVMRWQERHSVKSGFVVADIVKERGSRCYVAVTLQRLTERDPHVLFRMSPMKAWGKVRSYLAGDDSYGETPHFAEWNPPIGHRDCTVLMRLERGKARAFQLWMTAPEGSVELR